MHLATLGGLFIKLDHSFKAPKRIRDSTGQKQYSAVLTIMNEFCQVRGVVAWLKVDAGLMAHFQHSPHESGHYLTSCGWIGMCTLHVLFC